MKPLAIDLFCGLGGWSEGCLAEGWNVVGFDIERHEYPMSVASDGGSVKRPGMNWSGSDKPGYKAVAFNATPEFTEGIAKYPAQLVIQDVLTIHGSQFRNADLIVASPPCQEYSYMAMPWKLAKAKAAKIRADESGKMLADLTRLFDACFRIQREACEAAGRYIPMVVENVKGAQPWVGRAKANFGSFYLWGDVAMVGSRVVCGGEFGNYTRPMRNGSKSGNQGGWFAIGNAHNKHCPDGRARTRNLTPGPAESGMKGKGSWFGDYQAQKSATVDGIKCGGDWFNDSQPSISRMCSSKSPARKAASAQIAKIPLALSTYVARSYRPRIEATA